MASCPKCSSKIRKRSDNWYHCKRHGPVRKVASPEVRYTERTKIEGAEVVIKTEIVKPQRDTVVKINEMNWEL